MIADPVRYITSKWWTFVLRGVVALALAALAFAAPSAMAGALVVSVFLLNFPIVRRRRLLHYKWFVCFSRRVVVQRHG
jgi:hypothetical protein